MKKKLFRNHGVTLIELIMTISLMGLIFALGMYPMISQMRLFRAEKGEITLFDDANLTTFYITKDAMAAEDANVSAGNDEVTFTIATDYTTSPRTTKTVQYHVINNTELERNDSADGSMIITRKIDGVAVNGNPANLPAFVLTTLPNSQQHQLGCTIFLQDQDDPNITTRRDFATMLRCRAAK